MEGRWNVRFQWNKILSILLRVVPVDKKRVLLYSCLNQYNDNPKYIAEELHKVHPEWKLIWATGNLQSEVPDFLYPVRYGSLAYEWQKARSKVWIDNGYGFLSGYAQGIKRSLNLATKSKKQINISTWHGTPLKCIGADAQELSQFRNEDFYSTSDLILTSSEYEKKILQRITNGVVPLIITGYARNDRLLCATEEDKKKAKQKLNWDTGEKVVLYAPTYRDDTNWSVMNQAEALYSIGLLESLKEKFGGEWKIAVRAHQISRQMREEKNMTEILLNANICADMTEYLLACDAVITDYSGSIFDCMLAKIPCFLFVPDYAQYAQERGMYLTLDKLPMSHALDTEQVLKDIRSFDATAYREGCEKFLRENGFACEGKAAEKAVGIIERYLKSAP